MNHVIAQIIKAKLIVGAVEHIGMIGFGPGNRAQGQKTVIGGRIVRIIDKAAFIW